MAEKSYDGMIITKFNNIKYIANHLPTSFTVCLLKENPIIFTTAMDKELFSGISPIEVKEFESFSNLKSIFRDENLKKIAIEGSFPIKYYKKIDSDKTKKESWSLFIEKFLEKERMVKSKEEIENIKKATEIAHKSLNELDIHEKQGSSYTDCEIAYELGYLMRSNGASEESFETIVATGPNSSFPHAKLKNRKLENIVLMDWGSKYHGYCSDTSRTMIDGRNEKQKEIFDIVLETHNKTIKSIKSGIKACKIDAIARSIISEYGYGNNFIHATGHSLGLDVHEIPIISKQDKTILEKNMVITVEPGIYLKEEFGVRIEDTVVVGKNKAEIIGKLTYEL